MADCGAAGTGPRGTRLAVTGVPKSRRHCLRHSEPSALAATRGRDSRGTGPGDEASPSSRGASHRCDALTPPPNPDTPFRGRHNCGSGRGRAASRSPGLVTGPCGWATDTPAGTEVAPAVPPSGSQPWLKSCTLLLRDVTPCWGSEPSPTATCAPTRPSKLFKKRNGGRDAFIRFFPRAGAAVLHPQPRPC